MPGSDLAATPRDQTSGGGAGGSKYGKVVQGGDGSHHKKTGALSLDFAQRETEPLRTNQPPLYCKEEGDTLKMNKM